MILAQKFLRSVLTLLIVLFLGNGSVLAEGEGSNLGQIARNWQGILTDVDGALDAKTLSRQNLETLRESLVKNQIEALDHIEKITPEIDQRHDEIDQIKSKTPEGVEPSPIMKERIDILNLELGEFETDRLETQKRVDNLDKKIEEIDHLLRRAFLATLSSRTESALNPNTIKQAVSQTLSLPGMIYSEIKTLSNLGTHRAIFFENLPFVLLLLSLGIGLITFTFSRANQLIGTVESYKNLNIAAIIALTLRLIFLPLAWAIGVIFVFEALHLTGIIGKTLNGFLIWLDTLAISGTLALVFYYPLEGELRKARYFNALFMVFSLSFLGDALTRLTDNTRLEISWAIWVHITISVLSFLAIYRLSKNNRIREFLYADEDLRISRYLPLIMQIWRVLILISIILAVVGYLAAAIFLFRSVSFTAILLLLANRIFAYLLRVIILATNNSSAQGSTSSRSKDQKNLWPVLLLAALISGIAPIVAFIWGVPMSTLHDFWIRLKEGVTIGKIHLYPESILGFIFVFVAGMAILKFILNILQDVILPRTKLEESGRSTIVTLTGYLGYFFIALGAITAAGIDLSSLAFIAGALGVGIGFGLQNIVSNFISGIILLIERPIKQNDWVNVSGIEGHVRKIAVRATRIETFDGAIVIVPNADLISQKVTNWIQNRTLIRISATIGVSYDCDEELVRDTLIDIGRDVSFSTDIRPPNVILLNFGDSSINFELRFYVSNADFVIQARSEANMMILKRFRERGIEIPFPQRILHIQKTSADTSNILS